MKSLNEQALSKFYRNGAMRITDDRRKFGILGVLGDDVCLTILSRMANPMSVNDVSKTFNIPLSSAYKYVTALKDAGLIVVKESVIRDTGSKYSLFESTVKSVRVTFGEKGAIEVDIILNKDVTEKFMKYWRRLGDA